MRRLFLFAFLIICCCVSAQYGGLELHTDVMIDEESHDVTTKLYKSDGQKEVLVRTFPDTLPDRVDSLAPGMYILELTGPRKLNMRTGFTIYEGQFTQLDVDLNIDERPFLRDTLRNPRKRADAEFNLAYTDYKAIEPSGLFTKSYAVGTGFHYWNAFRKHLGLLYGCGVNYRYTGLVKDTSFIEAPASYRKKWEGYNYLDFHCDIKLRLSSASQQVIGSSSRLMLELGAIYNLPLYFRYAGRYEGNKKLSAQGIHQYTDVRVFVNFGYFPFLIFCEYRLNDFVIGNYPELPRYTFGIRILGKPLVNDRNN